MVKVNNIEFHNEAWADMLTDVVQAWAVPLAEQIANKANARVEALAEATQAQPDSIAPEGNTPGDKKIAERKMKARRAGKRAMHAGPPDGKRDYMVSVEGSNPLNLNDYRATVITVSERAKIDNARNNTLIRFLNGGGA